jgi:hypothetical protein
MGLNRLRCAQTSQLAGESEIELKKLTQQMQIAR